MVYKLPKKVSECIYEEGWNAIDRQEEISFHVDPFWSGSIAENSCVKTSACQVCDTNIWI